MTYCVVHGENSSRILARTSVISGDLARRVATPARWWRDCSIHSLGEPDSAAARPAAKLALRPRLPWGAGPLHPGLVHAAGGAVTARVPQGARGHRDAGVVHQPRACHRDHAAAAAPVRR